MESDAGSFFFDRCDCEAFGRFAASVTLVHRDVSGFNVATKSVGVEQGVGPAVSGKLCLHGSEKLRLLGKFDRKRLVIRKRRRYKLGQTNGVKEARPDATRER